MYVSTIVSLCVSISRFFYRQSYSSLADAVCVCVQSAEVRESSDRPKECTIDRALLSSGFRMKANERLIAVGTLPSLASSER